MYQVYIRMYLAQVEVRTRLAVVAVSRVDLLVTVGARRQELGHVGVAEVVQNLHDGRPATGRTYRHTNTKKEIATKVNVFHTRERQTDREKERHRDKKQWQRNTRADRWMDEWMDGSVYFSMYCPLGTP